MKTAKTTKTVTRTPHTISFDPGSKVLIRTVTMTLLGEVVLETAQLIVLTNGGWVADTGRFGAALATGKIEEFERAPGQFAVGLGAIVDVWPWEHDIPSQTI